MKEEGEEEEEEKKKEDATDVNYRGIYS